jgi:hypothetical protein
MAASATIAAGGTACPADLESRLRGGPLGAALAASFTLPVGCSVLRVDLPRGAKYTGFRYEAAGPNGRAEDCLVGKACPAGASRFVGEPIVREEGDVTTVLALFEASGDRRGTLTVYWSRAR